jgi:predicted PurR-regulated permease PerM
LELNKKAIKTIFFGVAGCILLYWILHETEKLTAAYNVVAGVLSPFAIGAVLAFILNVPMRSFERILGGIKFPTLRRVVALLLTILAVLLVLTVVFSLLIPQVAETAETFAARLPAFYEKVETNIFNFLEEHPDIQEWVIANTDFENIDLVGLAQNLFSMLGDSVETIMQGAVSAIGKTFDIVFDLFISIVFSIYCLFQKETLARQGRKLLYSVASEKFADETVRIMRLTNSTFSNFLSGQCLEVCILGSMFAICMAIFGMPFIPLVSVLVAVTAFIPVVGAFIGCIVGALFILVDDPLQAVQFVAMFLVLQQLENNLIYPRVVGTSIGLPGMWVLLAVAVGGEFMGVAGMFLMIPLSSVLYTLIRERTNKRLALLDIDEEKLKEQPPELRSRFRDRFKIKKIKIGNVKKLFKKK